MKLITQEEFLEMADVIAKRGSLRYKHQGKQYLAPIDEVNAFSGGIYALVTGEVSVLENKRVWVPTLDNCPAHHIFNWNDVDCHWVTVADFESGTICIDSTDGPIYILFSDSKEGSE